MHRAAVCQGRREVRIRGGRGKNITRITRRLQAGLAKTVAKEHRQSPKKTKEPPMKFSARPHTRTHTHTQTQTHTHTQCKPHTCFSRTVSVKEDLFHSCRQQPHQQQFCLEARQSLNPKPRPALSLSRHCPPPDRRKGTGLGPVGGS